MKAKDKAQEILDEFQDQYPDYVVSREHALYEMATHLGSINIGDDVTIGCSKDGEKRAVFYFNDYTNKWYINELPTKQPLLLSGTIRGDELEG